MRILLAIYLLELLLSYASMIEIFFFIKRVWLFIPLNVFLPGDMLYHIIYLGAGAHMGPLGFPESIYITKQGTPATIIFTLIAAVSVCASVLLFLSTQQQVLFKSLRSVGVPKLYVLTLEMVRRFPIESVHEVAAGLFAVLN